jgi:hypothetical protein
MSEDTAQSPIEELAEARRRIAELELSTKTVLSASQFLTIILVGPL